MRRCVWVVVFILACNSSLAQVSDERVREALRRGVRFLLSKQERNGSWHDGDYTNFPSGVTSLCTLALLNAGMTPDDPEISRALAYIRNQRNLEMTYTVALQTIVLCAAEPEQDLVGPISRNVSWLQRAQHKGAGDNKGSWGYGQNDVHEDPSNAQFALLALYEAERAGVPVADSTWRLALDYWKRIQRPDGSFGYGRSRESSGSMTCAGIGSMIIAAGQVSKLDASIDGDDVQCCVSSDDQDDSIERAIRWLGRNFSVQRNPSSKPFEAPGMYRYYYLYGLERVGRLAGRRFIGSHDWYREGVETLLQQQDTLTGYWSTTATDQLTCTAFSILFLSKGRRPVLMSKIKRLPEHDWNHHRHDVANLTRYVERLPTWDQDLTWQVVDIAAATTADLQQSPILFISGRDALDVAASEKEALKTYIETGGFVFAENCCDGDGFDRDFRALMAELFPDTPLRLLPKDHAIWFAEKKIAAEHLRPLEGLDACCRTGVVYCPEDLSCYWEVAKPERGRKTSDTARAKIQAALDIGANVVAYATGRQLRQKLDQPELVSEMGPAREIDRASLFVAKLGHNGGSDDAPSALTNALRALGRQTELPVSTAKRVLSSLDPQLTNYPIAFIHGRRAFQWTPAERRAIRRFVDNGGTIIGDAICASESFSTSFQNEMRLIFPDHQLTSIPPQHEMFTSSFHGHSIETVTLRDPRSRRRTDDPLSVRVEKVAPRLTGIEIDGRFVVVFSPLDISCALESRPSLECRGYTTEDAAKIFANIVLYAMQQD